MSLKFWDYQSTIVFFLFFFLENPGSISRENSDITSQADTDVVGMWCPGCQVQDVVSGKTLKFLLGPLIKEFISLTFRLLDLIAKSELNLNVTFFANWILKLKPNCYINIIKGPLTIIFQSKNLNRN